MRISERWNARALAVALAPWLAVLSGWSLAAAAGAPANHLAGSKSAYLARAEDQPVDWHPWSREAWELARKLDRPVLVDVGAVWCEWCTRMDRESYRQPEVARFINANFVAVKVDYDADIAFSARLQRAQAYLNLPSGLPLTGFATPDGKLYFGGTYFPATAPAGKPSFEQALKQALAMYDQERQQIEVQGFPILSEGQSGNGWIPAAAGKTVRAPSGTDRSDSSQGEKRQ